MTGSVSQLTGVVHLDLDVHVAEVVPVPPHPEEAPHLVTLGHGELVPRKKESCCQWVDGWMGPWQKSPSWTRHIYTRVSVLSSMIRRLPIR